jgi:hypothetical protein
MIAAVPYIREFLAKTFPTQQNSKKTVVVQQLATTPRISNPEAKMAFHAIQVSIKWP